MENRSMRSTFLSAAALTLVLSACDSPEQPAADAALEEEAAVQTPEAMTAVARLVSAEGDDVGIVTATSAGESVMISIEATNLPAGEHGVHVHTTGQCEGPAFESAGPHWNPEMMTHGLEGEEGQHAGDMPNLEVAEGGTGSLEYTLAGGATFAGLMDADGSAFMIHAMADDQATDPSGNSGDRIACGVFEMAGGEAAGATAGTTETM
jgi:Cu-Zn family superoxide dismutase